jgi:DNA polymerase-3 subunit alpha
VNTSENDFTIVYREGSEPVIRFGLGAIKGVGEKAVASIMEAREQDGPFRSIFDFCERVDLGAVNRGVVEALIKSGAFDSTGAMRKGLMTILDEALKHGSAAAADRKAGQMSLFGGPDDSSDDDPQAERSVPPLQWSESEMLAHEKATLGFYVTSHPLSSHADVLERYATARVRDLKQFSDGAEVILGGMITKLRTVLTKSGRSAGSKMGIVSVEDLSGKIEVIVFPKDLEKFRALLIPETVAFFKGQVDLRRDEPSLRVSDVIVNDEADEKLAHTVLVRLDEAGLDTEKLQALKALVQAHRGDRPFYIEMSTREGLKVTIRANGQAGVRPTAGFRHAVEELLGPGRVELIGHGRRSAPSETPVARAESQPEPRNEAQVPRNAVADSTAVVA